MNTITLYMQQFIHFEGFHLSDRLSDSIFTDSAIIPLFTNPPEYKQASTTYHYSLGSTSGKRG